MSYLTSETGSRSVDQADLELVIHLPQPPQQLGRQAGITGSLIRGVCVRVCVLVCVGFDLVWFGLVFRWGFISA